MNSEVLCLDVTVSAMAATLGQAIIPIPVLGALVGNISGMFLYDIAKEYCSEREQKIIMERTEKNRKLKEGAEQQYQELLNSFNSEFAVYSSLVEAAFDENINQSFDNSAALAASVGVEETKILRTEEDIRTFFCE